MHGRPVIGIVSRRIPFQHQKRSYPRYGVAIGYCGAVEAAGGTPLILPLTRDQVVHETLYGLLDGLLLPGGHDLDPHHYGEEPHPRLEEVDPLRDHTELELTRRALEDDMPVLGVCRGIQVLNVAAGGTLLQDIGAQADGECLQHFQLGEEWLAHTIDVHEGTLLHGILGADTVRVNSYHHQAVKDVAPGFRVSAVAGDGIVEAVESESRRFALGVQWHAEMLYHHRDFNLALFRRHVEEAGRYRRLGDRAASGERTGT